MEDPHHALAQQLTQSIMQEVLSTMSSTAGWTSIGNDSGIEGFNIPRDGPQMVKCTGTIERPAQQIKDFLWNLENKKKWDETLKYNRIVKSFSDNLRIIQEEANAPWPVSNRDFVVAQAWVQRDDGFLIFAKSIDGVVPDSDGVVRANVLLQGIYIQRETDTRSRITTLGSVDPRGSIPNMVVKKMSKKQIGKLVALRKAL
jgi:hypothetical protein